MFGWLMRFCEMRLRMQLSESRVSGLRSHMLKPVFCVGWIVIVFFSSMFQTIAFGNEMVNEATSGASVAMVMAGVDAKNDRGGVSVRSSQPSQRQYRLAFQAVWHHDPRRCILPISTKLRTSDDRNRLREKTFGIAFPYLSESERQILLKTTWNGADELVATAVPIVQSADGMSTDGIPATESVLTWGMGETGRINEPRNELLRETFDADAYWDAVLVAGGADEVPRLRQREQIAAISAGLPAFMQIPSPYDADLLLAHLHRTCFTGGYVATASVLSEPLERRAFNCVSASLLYYGLARQLGWSARIHLSTGHMRCSVRTTDGDYMVEAVDFPPNLLRRLRGGVAGSGGNSGGETTPFRAMRVPPAGDDLAASPIRTDIPWTAASVFTSVSMFAGDSASLPDTESAATGGPTMEWRPYLAPGGATPYPVEDERSVESLAVLESVLFHNRALTALEAGEPERSLACSAAAVWLDPDSKAARSNFIASLNNVAICYVQSGRPEHGEPWLRMACEMAPDHPILAENYQKLRHQISRNVEKIGNDAGAGIGKDSKSAGVVAVSAAPCP